MSDRAVHPVADLFPMLADDELAELAEDIKQRGLLQPIVLDSEGRILDGRNRLAACELVGVEPRYETYGGEDPDGYALAVNVQRRSLKPGARTLLIEQARRVAEKGGRRWRFGKNQIGNDGRLSEAAVVLDWAPHLVAQVMASGTSLRSAAEEARRLKHEAEEVTARMAALRERAPDLYELVVEGRMSLDEGEGAADTRDEKARQDAARERRQAEERASEEERQRQFREQERQESLERDRDRVRSVNSGWPTVRTILADPASPLAVEIIDGLGETDQQALRQIIKEIQR